MFERSLVALWWLAGTLLAGGLAVSLAAQPTGPAQGELRYDWTPVYAAEDAVVEVDLARVRRPSSGLVRIWTRWFWSQPRAHEHSEYEVSVILSDLDCERVRSREFVTVYKNADREIVFVEELEPEDVPWRQFAAGTPGAGVAERICALIADENPR